MIIIICICTNCQELRPIQCKYAGSCWQVYTTCLVYLSNKSDASSQLNGRITYIIYMYIDICTGLHNFTHQNHQLAEYWASFIKVLSPPTRLSVKLVNMFVHQHTILCSRAGDADNPLVEHGVCVVDAGPLDLDLSGPEKLKLFNFI